MGCFCGQRIDGCTSSPLGRIRRVDRRPTATTVCIVIQRMGNIDRCALYHQWCGHICGTLVQRSNTGSTHCTFATRVESRCGNVQGATQGQCQGTRQAEFAVRGLHVACHQGPGCLACQMEPCSRSCCASRVVCSFVPTRNGSASTTHPGNCNPPHGPHVGCTNMYTHVAQCWFCGWVVRLVSLPTTSLLIVCLPVAAVTVIRRFASA
jgi:hypothetical protein